MDNWFLNLLSHLSHSSSDVSILRSTFFAIAFMNCCLVPGDFYCVRNSSQFLLPIADSLLTCLKSSAQLVRMVKTFLFFVQLMPKQNCSSFWIWVEKPLLRFNISFLWAKPHQTKFLSDASGILLVKFNPNQALLCWVRKQLCLVHISFNVEFTVNFLIGHHDVIWLILLLQLINSATAVFLYRWFKY